jgi:hypothetical protein
MGYGVSIGSRPPVYEPHAAEPLGPGGRQVATGSASRSTRSAKTLHICAGGAGWVLLGLLWLWQFESRAIPRDWALVITAAAGGWLALAALSMIWVRWNQDIYRRRHRRRTPLIAPVQFETDAVGRRIVAADGLDGSRIVIRIDRAAALKRYLIG